eukprot:g16387.t1
MSCLKGFKKVNFGYEKSADFGNGIMVGGVEVAEVFCLHPILQQFHGLFISCNEPLDYTRWCSKCEKCAFVFLLMSAFLSPPAVWAVFGDDLFQKTDMLPVFLQLVGAGEKKEKPFECVGTFAEAKAAAELACRQAFCFV